MLAIWCCVRMVTGTPFSKGEDIKPNVTVLFRENIRVGISPTNLYAAWEAHIPNQSAYIWFPALLQIPDSCYGRPQWQLKLMCSCQPFRRHGLNNPGQFQHHKASVIVVTGGINQLKGGLSFSDKYVSFIKLKNLRKLISITIDCDSMKKCFVTK